METNNPGSKLTVQTGTKFDGFILNNEDGHLLFKLARSDTKYKAYFALYDGTSTTPPATVVFSNNGNNYITSGNLGIGTNNPGAMLHIIRNTGSYAGDQLQTVLLLELKTNTNVNVSNGYGSSIRWKIPRRVQDNGRAAHDAGYLGCYIWSGANSTGDKYAFNFTLRDDDVIRIPMTIRSDNKVGIGTTNPRFPLEVVGSGVATYGSGNIFDTGGGSNSYRLMNRASVNNYRYTYDTDPVGIFVYETVRAIQGFSAGSDKRIKKNIRDVSDNMALQKVRDISCVYYEYVDPINRRSGSTIGFIAQQVKQHMPMAVSLDVGVIPNEMRNLEDYTWVELTYDLSDNVIENKIYDESGNDVTKYKYKLTVNDLNDTSGNTQYRFHVSNDISGNDECMKEVVSLENEPKSFIFDEKWNYIFLYGKEINDFHYLSKEKLFSLNFSATQEIDRIQQKQLLDISQNKINIETLKIENDNLKLQNSTLTTKVNNLQNELNNLKYIVQDLIEAQMSS